jgi:hypothetical protein
MSPSKRRHRAAGPGDDGAAPGSRLRRAVSYLRNRRRQRVSDVEVIALRLAQEREQRRHEPWRAW